MLKKLAALAIVLGLVGGLAVPVYAHEAGDDDATSSSNESSDKTTEENARVKIQTETDQAKDKLKSKIETRLTETKLRVCKQRQSKISGIMSRSTVRAQKQLEVFTAISERVQAFYEKKGKVSATYDAKLAAVNAAKAAAEADIQALKELKTFDCESSDPKGGGQAYKAALDKVHESLKAYRTAIRELIQDVKKAQGDGLND